MIILAAILAQTPAGIVVDANRMEVGRPYQNVESLNKETLELLMGELNYDFVAVKDVDPKAFDYEPDSPVAPCSVNQELEGIQFLSLLSFLNQNQEVALVDYAKASSTMYFIPAARVQVQGTIRDYERAPVSVVQQDGKTIIANYPRENTLTTTDTAVFASEQMGFYIDKRPVSRREFSEFLRATNRTPPKLWDSKNINDQPVVNVTYEDAVSYAAWAGKRLPRSSEYSRAVAKFPELRRNSPLKEWTATVSNPGESPEKHYVHDGLPAANFYSDSFTGFRTAMDAR